MLCAARTALSSESLDMRRFLILIALLTTAGGHAADVPTVLIFGDSLTA
jgi:hypothetical protein